jgi:multidrug efflux system outer membrane protein
MKTGLSVFVFACAMLAGCAAVGPDYRAPQPALPERFASDPGPLAAEAPEARWWRGFADPRLDALIERALAANHDLRIAQARLAEARSLRDESAADRWPDVTVGAGYTDTRASADTAQPGQPRERDFYTAGFDAFWEIDLFGRVRRSVEAAEAGIGAAEAGVRDAQVSVAAEVARNYFELRGAQARLAVARDNAEVQRRSLELTRNLLDGGRGNALDVARAQAQYQTTLAAVPLQEAAARRAIHRIGVLTGQPPAALAEDLARAAPPRALPALGAIGDPAQLLRRRSDLRAAERDLAAATARVGVATADLYPRITIGGGIGTEARRLGDLGSGGTTYWSIVPRIDWAFLDSGRLRARVAQADAQAQAQLARFERSVLLALEETENALTDFGRQQVRRGALEEAARASEQAADLARQRFDAGVASFLDVLQAEGARLSVQDSLEVSRSAAATSLVAIYKALGGGWETEPQGR